MPSPFRYVTLSGLIACLSGCAPIDIMNLASGSSRYRTEHNISYGDQPRQTLDIYSPAKSHSTGCRILFVYGGSWRDGSKGDYGFVGAAFARHGHEVVIPDYRLYPEVAFPAFVHDIALSLSWYAQKEDPRPLVLMGHSAGALIAGLVSYDRQYLEAHGLSPKSIAAFVTLAGPHDFFLPTAEPRWTAVFGKDQKNQVQALPVRHITVDAPLTLILHGTEDKIVTPRSAHSLARALEAQKVKHEIRLYSDVGHRRIMASLAPPLQFLTPAMNDIMQFLHKNVCSPAPPT